MFRRDDFARLVEKVKVSERKRRRIEASDEENGTSRCSTDTGPVSTAVTANQSTSVARDNARNSEGETDAEQRGRYTLSPMDKIVKCYPALCEPRSGFLQAVLPDVPALFLDRLYALHDGDIPDSVFLKLRAEPWSWAELP